VKNRTLRRFEKKINERKNFEEYLKDIKFTYQTNYKSQEAAENDKIKYRNNVHKILFRQNLREEVEDLYSDLIKIVKND
jgi:hypothetical protein